MYVVTDQNIARIERKRFIKLLAGGMIAGIPGTTITAEPKGYKQEAYRNL